LYIRTAPLYIEPLRRLGDGCPASFQRRRFTVQQRERLLSASSRGSYIAGRYPLHRKSRSANACRAGLTRPSSAAPMPSRIASTGLNRKATPLKRSGTSVPEAAERFYIQRSGSYYTSDSW